MELKHILTLSRKHWEVGINLPSTLSSPKGQPAFLYILCTGQPHFTMLKEFPPLLPTSLLFTSPKYSDVTMAVGSNAPIPENGRPRKELPLGQEKKQHHGCLRAWAAESTSVGPQLHLQAWALSGSQCNSSTTTLMACDAASPSFSCTLPEVPF